MVSGNSIFCKDWQFLNVPASTAEIEGKSIELSALQFMKQLLSIADTSLGIRIACIAMQFANADMPNAETSFGKNTALKSAFRLS